MAKYNLDNYLEKDGLGFPLNFRRGNPNPLDNSSVWSSLAAAQNYAKTDPVAYVGQILTVVETVVIDEETGATTTKVTAYSIQDEAGTLKEIGTDASYDDSGIVTRIGTVEEAIGILNGDSTVEGSVDKKVADKVTEEIDAFVEKISEDEIVNTFKELVDYVAEHGPEAADMAKDISDLKQSVAKKVDVEEGKGLSTNDLTDTLLDKINKIAEGAQVNVIDSVDGSQFALDGNKHLTLLDIAIGKVTGLQAALDNKVDKVEGSRLITASEAERLEALVLGDNGQIEISGKVNADNVEGLDEKLDLKVDKVVGKSLVSDELITKLESVEDGAQANKIESVKVGGTLLDIVDKTVTVPVGAGLKASTEVTVAEDGTLGVGTIDISKITQNESATLILDGGTSVM